MGNHGAVGLCPSQLIARGAALTSRPEWTETGQLTAPNTNTRLFPPQPGEQTTCCAGVQGLCCRSGFWSRGGRIRWWLRWYKGLPELVTNATPRLHWIYSKDNQGKGFFYSAGDSPVTSGSIKEYFRPCALVRSPMLDEALHRGSYFWHRKVQQSVSWEWTGKTLSHLIPIETVHLRTMQLFCALYILKKNYKKLFNYHTTIGKSKSKQTGETKPKHQNQHLNWSGSITNWFQSMDAYFARSVELRSPWKLAIPNWNYKVCTKHCTPN